MPSSREQILANADVLTERPEAIEAFWDGDSGGWYVILVAVLKSDKGYRDYDLGTLRDGDDFFRLLDGQVPPWPEAVRAGEIGRELADRFGVPFYFPSSEQPGYDCPRWSERDEGFPCRRCGLLLTPNEYSRGDACYSCLRVEERAERESRWTPEERAGPRCYICGTPTKETRDGSPMCPECLDRYESYVCSRCGEGTLILKTIEHSDLCSICEIRKKLEAAPAEHRQSIVAAYTEYGLIAAIKLCRNLLGLSISDAQVAISLLSDPDDAPSP